MINEKMQKELESLKGFYLELKKMVTTDTVEDEKEKLSNMEKLLIQRSDDFLKFSELCLDLIKEYRTYVGDGNIKFKSDITKILANLGGLIEPDEEGSFSITIPSSETPTYHFNSPVLKSELELLKEMNNKKVDRELSTLSSYKNLMLLFENLKLNNFDCGQLIEDETFELTKQKEIIKELYENPNTTIENLMKKFGLSKTSTEKYIYRGYTYFNKVCKNKVG